LIEHHMVTCQREQVVGQQEYGEQPFQYRRIAANVLNMKIWYMTQVIQPRPH
jgi:hypothetical protein